MNKHTWPAQGSRLNGWYAPTLRHTDLMGLGLWTDANLKAFLRSASRNEGLFSSGSAHAILGRWLEFAMNAHRQHPSKALMVWTVSLFVGASSPGRHAV